MNATSFRNFTFHVSPDKASRTDMTDTDNRPHLAVQILAVIFLGVVSIVAISMAFNATWVAGIAVLAILFPMWMKSPAFGARPGPDRRGWPKMDEVAPHLPGAKPTGNASFDAYRADMLRRLEQESQEFEAFLDRLRDARDKMEFDQYMNDRVARARDATPIAERGAPAAGY